MPILKVRRWKPLKNKSKNRRHVKIEIGEMYIINNRFDVVTAEKVDKLQFAIKYVNIKFKYEKGDCYLYIVYFLINK